MAGVRIEESLVTSLHELRAIEVQRQADERAAVEAAVHAQRHAREAAERAVREAEVARLHDHEAAQLAAQRSRDAAERAARLEIERAAATERARCQAALEERRLVEEVALRREVARRQRPRWMLALTGLAVATAVGLGGFALARAHDADAARVARDRAIEARAHAVADARAAQLALDAMTHDLAELEARIEQALARVTVERTHAQRLDAEATLAQLRRRQAELKEQQRQRDARRSHDARTGPLRISDDCLSNPLCKEPGVR